MNNRLYTFFAAIVMVVLLAPVTETRAQRQVQVMELQKQPDGTEIYVQKTIEVPEKPASVIAAEKARAASVTADEDDLQYYLNHIVKTRAGESAVVIDLSTFSATTRETTLEVNQGISIKFTNGTLKRGTGLAKGSPIIRISNGTEVEFDETVTISGENLTTNGPAVELQDASLKTAAWIGNTRYGTQGVVVTTIFASSSSSKLEVTGGTISSGGVAYYGTQPLIVSGGDIGWTRIYSEADAIISGENTIIPISFENKTSKLYLKSAVKNLQFYDYYNVISDGYAVATGYDGYQLTESDLQMINVTNYDESVNDLKDYEKRLEGNSIVMRKIVNELVDIVEDYPVYEEKFNLCDAISFSSTTWSQFDNYILDRLNLTLEQFNAQYEADIDETTIVDQSDGSKLARANVYSDTQGTKATYVCPNTGNRVQFGTVTYRHNEIYTTCDVFQWSLTEDELEYLTHEKETLPVNFKQYIRYIGRNGAKYKYIYVKLEANIDREADPETGIKEKINNYWFGLDGNADGWDAVALSVNYPNFQNGTPTTWRNTLSNAFVPGVDDGIAFTDATLNNANTYLQSDADYRKFFFAPINTTITDFHGNAWTITAKSSASDEKWNAFVCHNDICCAENHEDIAKTAVDHATNSVTNPEYRAYDANCTANLHGSQKYTTHKFQVTADGKSDDAKNSAILQKCAIDYREGCFENAILYATKDGENFTPIVELDKATGELSLIRPAVANPQDASRNDYVPFSELDMVLNAIGYKGDQHENISEQLHTWIGVVVNNGCGVARDLFTVHGNNNDNYSIFETSWQRPINLVTTDPKQIEDANHNGELICVYDHLAFYDWRGPVDGDMEGANKWLWGYYNIHSIKFNLDPAVVKTNMYQASEDTFVPLSSVSKYVHFWAYKNKLTPNDNLYEFTGNLDFRGLTTAEIKAREALTGWKDNFGYIFYENNGENVNTFTVKVPVEICYEWGHLDTYVTITILSTQGGLQSDINNAADGTETTFNVSDYDELTTGILIPTGKKIKLTATSNVTLASNFSGDYIFRTEGDAQLDITVPGFSGYSSTALPKYGFVAGGSASKIIVNQSGANTLALPNTLLATENGGTIDCYANISTKGIYNAAGGTMNIYSESGEVETFTDDGGTVNITGPVKFYSTFTSLGTATLLSENVTSLAKLVLGKQSSMTFTSKWVKPNSLNISFKDNDYVLDQTYITFESSTTMLSGFETVSFTLQSEHSAYLDNNTHQLSIEEVDGAAMRNLDATYDDMARELVRCQEILNKIEDRLESYYKQGLLTEIECQNYIIHIATINDDISVANQYLSTYEGLRPVFYGKKSVYEWNTYADELANRCVYINEKIEVLEADVENLAASRKKPFTNTDDLQDYLNSLAGNNATTPSDPAKVSVEEGTNIDDLTIPKDTHVEIDIDGNGGGTDDLQAYLNGLVNVSEGGSLTMKGKWVVPTGALNPRIEVRGIIDIYATIVIEGTREEVIHVYSGGTANWRGEMQGGKIVNEGELNHYSGSTDYIENRGTAKHTGGTCHHVVNYKTYTFSGGTIDGSASPYTCAFENHGSAHLTGGTIIHHTTLIYIVKGATTYIDGAQLDDSNATTTVLAYDDFHIRGDYAPKNIVIDNGVCIHLLTAWTVRWHITFIDNRTTIRKVIFHSENFNVTEEYIKYIDFILPDGYRWYYNPTDNGLEIRDKKVYDTDDLQHFLDLLKTNPGTVSDPVVLDGDNHTVPLPLDNAGGFRFPDNTYIVVRDIIFRYVSPTAKRRWTVPSGSTVVLRNVTIDGGDGASNYEDADIFVDGGSLHIDNVVFVNVHLNITRTIYIRSAVTARIYIRYTKDGALAAGDRIAEGAEGYYLTDSDVLRFTHIDYDGVQNLWQFRRNGNVIELYLSDPSGISTVDADGTARAYVSPDGTLRLSGIPADEPCAVFRTDGTLLVKGTASELTARPFILAPGAYILRTRNASLKFVR